jgi:transposase
MVFFMSRTGCQWKMLPKEHGSGSACHRRFQEWIISKVFQRLWVRLLEVYDDLIGIKWTWQSLDSISVKAPWGEMTGWSKSYRQIEVNLEPSGIYYSRSKRHSIINCYYRRKYT